MCNRQSQRALHTTVNNELLSVFRSHLTASGRCKHLNILTVSVRGISFNRFFFSWSESRVLLSLSAVVGAPCSLKSPAEVPFEMITRYLSGPSFIWVTVWKWARISSTGNEAVLFLRPFFPHFSFRNKRGQRKEGDSNTQLLKKTFFSSGNLNNN